METHHRSATGLVAHEVFKEHHTPHGHPERPERYDAVIQGLRTAGILDELLLYKPRRARLGTVAAAHSRAYIHLAEEDCLSGQAQLRTGDTSICEASFDVALRACGGAKAAVEAVVEGRVRNAFCAVRPPGHHATATQGMGFCIFNNAAVAARHAQRELGIDRVAILDWDVHHGNGTQDIFYDDGSVFYFSTHQHPWFPGTGAHNERGEGDGSGTTLNCPLPAGSGGADVIGAFERELIPAMDDFKPELVILSAGFDAREGDPLGLFRLADADFATLTDLAADIARRHAQGRIVSLLEGGYNLEGLASASAAHVAALVEAGRKGAA